MRWQGIFNAMFQGTSRKVAIHQSNNLVMQHMRIDISIEQI